MSPLPLESAGEDKDTGRHSHVDEPEIVAHPEIVATGRSSIQPGEVKYKQEVHVQWYQAPEAGVRRQPSLISCKTFETNLKFRFTRPKEWLSYLSGRNNT